MLRLWGVVLFANLVGTYLFALCIGRIPIFPAHTQQVLIDISRGSAEGGFGVVFMRAVFAGWLIALMVWLLPAAESARVSTIIIITYLIGLGSFNHVIAGSTKFFLLVVTGAETWHAYILRFFFPTLLGNVVGGVSLVAFLGHAQVVADTAASPRASGSEHSFLVNPHSAIPCIDSHGPFMYCLCDLSRGQPRQLAHAILKCLPIVD